ncbi:MAG: SulP family inorganic anion transporter [Candidatus Gracilibacteria bacterium]|nr:SulP family inorganic anion transporter [Candidatus Gracilibacteria bacterium]MDQ7021992.1 SulP family inorganic anion transporter [Candidatus Gracilibacteria bacterium]
MNFIKNLKQYLPFLEWIPELKNPKVLKADIIAGITVAIILVPQSMAYAQLVGVPAYLGLYTAFLPVMIGAIFSSSRQLSTGPVTIISLITATTLAPFFTNGNLGTPEYIMYVALLAIMIGIMQVIMGFLKLGNIFNFLSHSVILGFLNAAAIIIGFTQVKYILGVDLESTEHFYESIPILFNTAMASTHFPTLIFGGTAFLALVLFKIFKPKFPSYLIVTTIGIIISYFIGFEDKYLGAVVGEINAGFVSFYNPFSTDYFTWEVFQKLIPGALIIGFLGFTEAISIAKAIGIETKKTVSTNQMLLSEGFANISAGYSQGFPVSGTFSRSAVNLRAGAVTPFASIVTGLIIGAVILFFTKYLYHLPIALLGAIILYAVISLIKVKPIIHSWKLNKTDTIVSIITFFATIYFAPHLETGIFIGVFLSLIFHIQKSMKPRFAKLGLHSDGSYRSLKIHNLADSKKISIYRFYGKLYFVNIWYFEEVLMKNVEESKDLKVIILDFAMIPRLDSGALEVLHSLVESLKNAGIEVHFTTLNSVVEKQFKNAGIIKVITQKNIHSKIYFAIKKLKNKRKDLDLDMFWKDRD